MRLPKFLLAAALTLAFSCLSVSPAETWPAGVAKTIITPEKPMWMAGYSPRDQPATVTWIDLWGKWVVMEDPQRARADVIIVTLVGIDPGLAHSHGPDIREEQR